MFTIRAIRLSSVYEIVSYLIFWSLSTLLTKYKPSAWRRRGDENKERLVERTYWCALITFTSYEAESSRPSVDIGSITVLYSQPVAALQVLSPDGNWRWVKHIPNALVSLMSSCRHFLLTTCIAHTGDQYW